MRRRLADAGDFGGCALHPRDTSLLDRCWQFVLLHHFNRRVVKPDDRGVQVEVHVYGGRIFRIVRQAEMLWEVHEEAGELVVELSVPLPVGAVLEIVGSTSVFRAVNMVQNVFHEVAGDDHAREAGILGTVVDIIEKGSRLLPSRAERIFR